MAANGAGRWSSITIDNKILACLIWQAIPF